VDPFAPPVMAPRVIVAGERVLLNRPIDLTHLTSASATAIAGSATVGAPAGGTGTAGSSAAGTGAAGAPAPAGGAQGASGSSLAEPARPTGHAWNCPWPSAAQEADLHAQTVMVRVTVAADGSPVRATAQRDPGYGFGAAAEACAMRQPYRAARDDSGQPVQAVTPTIAVRFTAR